MNRRRTLLVGGGAAVVALAGLLTWALWPTGQPRARQYLAFTACLLTDEHGITGPAAVPVWAGMQDASLRTHAKVEYLPVFGAQTAVNARPYLTSLVQRHCDVLVGVGPAPVAAVDGAASSYPKVQFVTVGDAAPARGVTAVPSSGPAAVRGKVSGIVTAAVGRSTGR